MHTLPIRSKQYTAFRKNSLPIYHQHCLSGLCTFPSIAPEQCRTKAPGYRIHHPFQCQRQKKMLVQNLAPFPFDRTFKQQMSSPSICYHKAIGHRGPIALCIHLSILQVVDTPFDCICYSVCPTGAIYSARWDRSLHVATLQRRNWNSKFEKIQWIKIYWFACSIIL